jgi:hypothetical protein
VWLVLQVIQASGIPHGDSIVGGEHEIEFAVDIADMRIGRRSVGDVVADIVIGHD